MAISKVGWIPSLSAILPHGVLELPALFLASAYGIFLGVRFSKLVFKKENFLPHFLHANRVYFKIILPLFFFAAIIETTLIFFIK